MKAILILFIICYPLFYQANTLTGTWEYAGDISHGVKEQAPKEYTLRRIYDKDTYQAFIIEKGYPDEEYEKGRYALNTDTCLETQTYCSQPSKVTGVTLHYHYTINRDTLTFKGFLPNGTRVEEYWKKVK